MGGGEGGAGDDSGGGVAGAAEGDEWAADCGAADEEDGGEQAVFARLINDSVQTVHAWEQGRGRPSGPTLRFLRLLERRPELVREFGE